MPGDNDYHCWTPLLPPINRVVITKEAEQIISFSPPGCGRVSERLGRSYPRTLELPVTSLRPASHSDLANSLRHTAVAIAVRVLQARNNRTRHTMSRRTRPKRNMRVDMKSVLTLTLLAPVQATTVKSCIMRFCVGEMAPPRGERGKPGLERINYAEQRMHGRTCHRPNLSNFFGVENYVAVTRIREGRLEVRNTVNLGGSAVVSNSHQLL